MSSIEKVNINVQGSNPEQPIIIHLLEGKAPEPKITVQPKSLSIDGDINTPVNFVKGVVSVDKYSPEDAIVTYSDDPKEPWVQVQYDLKQTINTTVTGKLKPNKDLAAFRFNEVGVFTNKTFAEMIMNHPHCFANKGEAKALRKSLQNYQAKFNTIVQKANDNQGNTEDLLKTEFDKTGSGIPNVINLKMPLFDGGEDVEFVAEVEIEVQMTQNKPEARFSFFTQELELVKRDGAKSIIAEQIKALSGKFVCIRKNL